MPQSPTAPRDPAPAKPLKPILKQPLKPNTHINPLKPALTPAPPPNIRQGDPLWLRVMHTKESQWRLINTIALHELNLLERSACAQLDALADQLDRLINQTTKLDALVRRCRALRARQNFVLVASHPLRNAVRLLAGLKYESVRDALVESSCALEMDATGIAEEVVRFRTAARRFGDAANGEGLDDLVGVAKLLEELASVAARAPGAVSCAAHAVVDAGVVAERARLEGVEEIVDMRNPDFVCEPSFVE